MLSYPSGISVSSRCLTKLAEGLHQQLRERRTRWRRLEAGQQALLVLAYLRTAETMRAWLSRSSSSTACCCGSIESAWPASGRDRPYYSGKYQRHGVSVQVVADPAGRLIETSPALPRGPV